MTGRSLTYFTAMSQHLDQKRTSHIQNSKLKSQSVQKIEWKQTITTNMCQHKTKRNTNS